MGKKIRPEGPEIVFAAYRPRAGKEAELVQILKRHIPALLRLEMITARAPIIVRAGDGTVIEIFEWRDAEMAKRAHTHPEIAAIWESIGKIADYVPLAELSEAKKPFSHYLPVAL